MSLHRSLKTKPGALNEHRNVLTRAERIERLADRDRFTRGKDSPLSLPKVANRQLVTKKKKTAKEEEGAAPAVAGEEKKDDKKAEKKAAS